MINRIICNIQHDYRVAIRTEGMIEDLVAHLRVPNEELQMHCSATIFKVSTQSFEALLNKYGTLRDHSKLKFMSFD